MDDGNPCEFGVQRNYHMHLECLHQKNQELKIIRIFFMHIYRAFYLRHILKPFQYFSGIRHSSFQFVPTVNIEKHSIIRKNEKKTSSGNFFGHIGHSKCEWWSSYFETLSIFHWHPAFYFFVCAIIVFHCLLVCFIKKKSFTFHLFLRVRFEIQFWAIF